MTILDDLQQVLSERRHGDPGSSYVASLHHKGLNKILEKVGEEAVEVLLAAKDADIDLDKGASQDAQLAQAAKLALIHETADLWFHSLVLLSHLGLTHQDVLEELARRFGTSGHQEKAARSGN